MKKMLWLVTSLFLAAPVVAADFSARQYTLGSVPVTPGALLECHRLNPSFLERDSPKVFAWAMAAGLIERSAISATIGYTEKVTSRYDSDRALLVGCWIATKIITEQVNGKERAYAQGVYQLNDALGGSPLMALAVCRKTRNGPGYIQGDYRLLDEKDADECKSDQWQQRLPSVRDLQGHTQLFNVRKLRDRPGYVREVGW